MAAMKEALRREGISFSEEPSGRVTIDDGPEDFLMEIDPGKGLLCLFGVDMEELRLLVSGASNEDLGEDELQRVAREHVRPLVRRYQPAFTAAGFSEEVEVDAASYAVTFVKPVDSLIPDRIVEMIRWCSQIRPVLDHVRRNRQERQCADTS